MKIISFAYTTPALVARRKTVTRRDWYDQYAQRWKPFDQFQAYDRSPRYGGQAVAICEVLSVCKEPMRAMPDDDFEEEGFAYLAECKIKPPRTCPLQSFTPEEFAIWRDSDRDVWVIRFKLLRVLNSGGHGNG